MSNEYEYLYNHIKKRKRDLISVFGGQCCLCGFNKYQEALEFHHVNPEEKEFTFSENSVKALSKQLDELKKCILVCSNCHRGIHAGYEEVPENWGSFYSDEVANELLKKLNQIKHKATQKCKNCGKEISKGSKYCDECRSIIRQKVKDKPDRDELKSLIRELPFTKIAEMYDVSDNAIRKWCIKVNLPSTKKEILSIDDSDWEQI